MYHTEKMVGLFMISNCFGTLCFFSIFQTTLAYKGPCLFCADLLKFTPHLFKLILSSVLPFTLSLIFLLNISNNCHNIGLCRLLFCRCLRKNYIWLQCIRKMMTDRVSGDLLLPRDFIIRSL